MLAGRRTSKQGLLAALVCCGWSSMAGAFDWLPIDPAELKMTSEPKAPAASAIYLYRQIDNDDDGPDETVYVRIKILTEEGRKYADVEIPFEKSTDDIGGIQARTIRADGSIVKFEGTTYEKPIVQTAGVKYLAKTFTLPDAQVGSIIEYRYKHSFARGYVFNSHWILSDSLFTKYAKFSLIPYRGFPMSFSWPIGLPPGTDPPKLIHDVVRLEARDVPAFVSEEHMPPANQLTFRVDFVYLSTMMGPEKDPAVFWKKFGKKQYSEVEHFLDEKRTMTDAIAQIVAPDDSPEVKLRKIYARTQRIRNTSFERQKSDQEAKREDLKSARNVADVWNRGYGDAQQITWLFVALARAAGLPADAALVSTRDKYFFNQTLMNPTQLNSNIAIVTLGGVELFLDPGMAFAPYGLLPWAETAVTALRLTKDGGAWITTPLPKPVESRAERHADLELTPSGTLQGRLQVSYTGQQALWRRLEERHEDDADRKKFLEDQISNDVPGGIQVELTNVPDWDGSSQSLVAEFDLKVPGWAAPAGQRFLIPAGLFGGPEKREFHHATRIHPLYFEFPYESVDDINIKLPQNWQMGATPAARADDRKVLAFSSSADAHDGILHLQRDLAVNITILPIKYYADLQDFFQKVRSSDEEEAILVRSPKSVGH
jgi:Domain of Unknown Function with PDB structure (DUF3857)/Transglutaminase-like superfamily